MKKIKIKIKFKQIEWRFPESRIKFKVPALPLRAWLVLALLAGAALNVGLYAAHPEPLNYAFLALYADWKAGEPVWVDNDVSDYHYDSVAMIWAIETNSEWLLEQATLIVPYLGYENLTPLPRYPKGIYFAPFDGAQSFHILGRYLPLYNVVLINERFLLDVRRQERADLLLSVIVHELIHAQGARYTAGTSPQLESATEAATIEALAAMCNHNNELACKAFWNELKDYALTAFELEAPRPFYEVLRYVAEGPKEQAPYRKSMRFWAGDPEGLEHIKVNYILVPWQQLIKPAAEGWAGFNTGFQIKGFPDDHPGYLVADFDDVRALLGWLLHLI